MIDRSILIASSVAFFLTIKASFADAPEPVTVDDLATKTGATVNKAPDWTKGGAFVYRLATPDNPDVLPLVEQEFSITSHMLDGSVRQIPITMGFVGHDHLGVCNWDGLWPDWDRVTFRADHDWTALHDFMQRAKDQDNTLVSFHVNLTDVNAGLRDYPESQAFFQKLVETKSMYCRDVNPVTHKRDVDPPYVLQQLPSAAAVPKALTIVSLVNYKNFWDSGLAKEMIDGFYSHLPYAPPLLYVDVLTTMGGNFNTGFPTGPLGGSEQTQEQGVYDITNYLKSKGTSLATEGDRPYLYGKGVTYGWLHCLPGYSTNDYSYIAGASRYVPLQQVAGDTGCFDVSPITATPDMMAKQRQHYANLLAGKPDAKIMPDLKTWHISDRTGTNDEFDLIPPADGKPGIGGDGFRGDLVDLINNFYLISIQELYYIGKGAVRTAIFDKEGVVHVTKFGIADSSGAETFTPASDFAPAAYVAIVKKTEDLMLELPFEIHYNAAQAGKYRLTLYGHTPGNTHSALNVYVNGHLAHTALNISFPSQKIMDQPFPLGDLDLNAGDNVIGFDVGPLYMKWSDGTTALWSTPYLRKGFKVTNGDVTFADDYDRMWPDTWSGQKKIYFFSWDGTGRTWKLPQEWASVGKATLYPLTPDGRGAGVSLAVADRSLSPKLLPQVPYVLVPQ